MHFPLKPLTGTVENDKTFSEKAKTFSEKAKIRLGKTRSRSYYPRKSAREVRSP